MNLFRHLVWTVTLLHYPFHMSLISDTKYEQIFESLAFLPQQDIYNFPLISAIGLGQSERHVVGSSIFSVYIPSYINFPLVSTTNQLFQFTTPCLVKNSGMGGIKQGLLRSQHSVHLKLLPWQWQFRLQYTNLSVSKNIS